MWSYVQVTLDDVTKGTLRYKCSYDAKYEDVVMVMRANKVIEHVHPDVLVSVWVFIMYTVSLLNDSIVSQVKWGD